MPNKSNEQIGDGNFNQQIDAFKEDLGIIDEIYKAVLKSRKKNISGAGGKNFIDVNKKIELNINNSDERKEIKELFESIYDKISLVEKTFSNLDKGDQREIHIDIKDQYNERIRSFQSDTYKILRDLIKHYTPSDKTKNPRYNNLAKAFVLFFFDDCTIGRKE